MSNGKPFLKWAGGKTQLIPQLEELMPADFGNRFDTYVEPFIGGGAMFFHMAQKHEFEKTVINDYNVDLVNVYRVIQQHPEKLLKQLTLLQDDYYAASEEERKIMFYSKREEFNTLKTGLTYDVNVLNSKHVACAALFIFLNKTCFNGLYRVNSKGLFNVPFANPKKPLLADVENINTVSVLLQNTLILSGDYQGVEKHAVGGNVFMYLDPPYRPVAPSDRGNIYVASGFNDDDQRRLALWFKHMAGKGASVMLSNSDPTMVDPEDLFFNELYAGFNVHTVYAKRMINRDAAGRGGIREIVVTSYPVV